jgi:hypothetical protein
MDANDLLKAALPAAIAGGAVYVVGSFVGPRMGPGWEDIIHGGAFFVGLIWLLINIRRKAPSAKNAKKSG